MAMKITLKQARKIHQLVRKECYNCYEDNCLLLDDGGPQKCVQLISICGIYCKYFLNAVLPLNKELHAKIIQQNEKA